MFLQIFYLLEKRASSEPFQNLNDLWRLKKASAEGLRIGRNYGYDNVITGLSDGSPGCFRKDALAK